MNRQSKAIVHKTVCGGRALSSGGRVQLGVGRAYFDTMWLTPYSLVELGTVIVVKDYKGQFFKHPPLIMEVGRVQLTSLSGFVSVRLSTTDSFSHGTRIKNGPSQFQ